MNQELKEIPLNNISVISNYRKTFHEVTLKQLAQSIKANGVLEPIIVRPFGVTAFQIIAGERRVRAAKLAGLVTIPAVVRDVDDKDVLKLQIIENAQREHVPFMEEAFAIKRLKEECTLDMAEICKIIGKSESYLYFQLSLCAMSETARQIAEKGWISKGAAWEIAKLKDKDQQTQAAEACARTQKDKQISISGVKHYIRENFVEGSDRYLRKARVQKFGPSSDYIQNWKHYLVRFNPDQFERFKKIVRGRTQNEVLGEAVDLVMRRANDEQPAQVMEVSA